MILVTGATGNVSSELVQELLAAEQSVRVLTRDARKVAALDARIQRAVGDFELPETLVAAMQGVEKVFLVTAELGTSHVESVLGAAKQAGVQRIVYLSSLGADDTSLQLGKWHYDREAAIRASGLEWTFLRPGQFMSNALMWADTIKSQGAVYFPGGAGKAAPIDPGDIALVAALALTQPGHNHQIYALTGSELLTASEQVEILSRAIGKPLRYTDVPPEAARAGMLKSGMSPVLADAITQLYTRIREGFGAQPLDTFTQVTGQQPRTFENWCRNHAPAFQ